MKVDHWTRAWENEMASEVRPRDYLAPDSTWPEGPLADDAPPAARLGQAIAANLRQAMQDQDIGLRPLARLAGLTHPTVKAVLDGDRLPSAHSLLLLEITLRTPLWPAALHRTPSPPPSATSAGRGV